MTRSRTSTRPRRSRRVTRSQRSVSTRRRRSTTTTPLEFHENPRNLPFYRIEDSRFPSHSRRVHKGYVDLKYLLRDANDIAADVIDNVGTTHWPPSGTGLENLEHLRVVTFPGKAVKEAGQDWDWYEEVGKVVQTGPALRSEPLLVVLDRHG